MRGCAPVRRSLAALGLGAAFLGAAAAAGSVPNRNVVEIGHSGTVCHALELNDVAHGPKLTIGVARGETVQLKSDDSYLIDVTTISGPAPLPQPP